MEQLNQLVGPSPLDFLFRVVLALIILVVGWLLALLFAAITRNLLKRTKVDKRVADQMDSEKTAVSIEDVAAKLVFYFVLLITLVAVFQALNLIAIAQSFNQIVEAILVFLPKLLGAGILALVAWLVATVLKLLVSKGLGMFKFDDKLGEEAGLAEEGRPPLSETLATVVYWFVWLLFLPAILGVLELGGLLQPVQDMVAIVLAYLPNIIGAIIVLLIGWFIARIVRLITVNFFVAIGTDRLGERVGLSGNVTGGQTLSQIIGLVVYILILIPVIIAALQVLDIAAISVPATAMLGSFMSSIPLIFGALVILAVTYMLARVIASLVTALLTGIGFNKVLGLVGMKGDPSTAGRTPSEVVGYLIIVGLMLFATVEAAGLLGFTIIAVLIGQFTEFFFLVILALIILWLGIYAGNIAYRVVVSTAGSNANLLGQIARIVIIIYWGRSPAS
jgi:hypothetical protein